MLWKLKILWDIFVKQKILYRKVSEDIAYIQK